MYGLAVTSGLSAGWQGYQMLAQSAVAVSHTGNTNETALATVPIPSGAIGPNGSVRITTLWTYTNSGNVKNLRVRLGGISGTAFRAMVPTTTATAQDICIIRNRDSASSQIGWISGSVGGLGANTPANVTATIDTAVATDLVISGQLVSSGETITLEGYTVEICHTA